MQLTQGYEKLATSPTNFSVVNLYVYFLGVFLKKVADKFKLDVDGS